MQHKEQLWKHKESNEVIDNLTYRDLDQEHRSNFEEHEPEELIDEGEAFPIEQVGDLSENTGSEVVTDPVVNTGSEVVTDPVVTGAPFDEEL